MGFQVLCLVSWATLAFLWWKRRQGTPYRDQRDFVGMAGFWAVITTAAIVANWVL